VSTAQGNVDAGSGIHTDKARDLRGESEVHVHTHDLGATVRALVKLGVVELEPGEVIDGVAVELPEPHREERALTRASAISASTRAGKF
jgi:hypothetical protein